MSNKALKWPDSILKQETIPEQSAITAAADRLGYKLRHEDDQDLSYSNLTYTGDHPILKP